MPWLAGKIAALVGVLQGILIHNGSSTVLVEAADPGAVHGFNQLIFKEIAPAWRADLSPDVLHSTETLEEPS